MYQRHYGVPLSYDLTTFQILGQKLKKEKISLVFWSKQWHQKDILKLTDLHLHLWKWCMVIKPKIIWASKLLIKSYECNTFISHWHIIRRWTWLLGAATFPASWLQNKCKSLSKQIQVIIGWMLKLLGRVNLIMQLANHSDFPMTIGKEQLTIRTDFLTWKSLHKCYMVSKCFFSVVCSHHIVQFWTCCWSSAKVMFGWTQFFSEGLIASAYSLILREE